VRAGALRAWLDFLGMPKDTAATSGDQPGPGSTSPSEEMYLITVARAEEEGHPGPLPLAALAQSLSISPVSANQMVWRLADRDLLEYRPYQGVLLTPAGRATAEQVLRGRRLWTGFLVGHLGFAEEEADALACEFEHLTPPELAERLEVYLGYGATPPGGVGRPQDGPSDCSRGGH